MMGAPSAEFSESWNGILYQAQASLVALLVINYRDSLEKEHDRAYDLLSTSRSQLTQQEMERIKEQLAKQHKLLQEKRWKKARKLCESNGMSWTLERLEQLRTRNHIDSVLFNVEDLTLGEVSMEESNMEEEVQVAVQAVEEDDNVRLIGRFVSGSVVNLSGRELSEEDVSLLSKGLKFSPTPTDIDKAQLKADIEDFKRRMRDGISEIKRTIVSHMMIITSELNLNGSPLRMTQFWKTISRCWRRRYCLSRRRVRILVIFLLLNNFL